MCTKHSAGGRHDRSLCRLTVVTLVGFAVQGVLPSAWRCHSAVSQPSASRPPASSDVGRRRLVAAGVATAGWATPGRGARAVDMVDPFPDRANGIVNLAVSQNPLKAFKEKQVIAVDTWAKVSDEVEAALAGERPDLKRVKSLMDLKLAAVTQAMNRANYIAPEARPYQAAFRQSVNDFSAAANSGDADGARRSLAAARAGFETWLAAKVTIAGEA
mmetsp:Transcript_108445/g.317260  ORF Transcript_108445/g.317260 Transcript_108445/m.317260 type:complete len:216 (-) Transcript_108445:102-749(-)